MNNAPARIPRLRHEHNKGTPDQAESSNVGPSLSRNEPGSLTESASLIGAPEVLLRAGTGRTADATFPSRKHSSLRFASGKRRRKEIIVRPHSDLHSHPAEKDSESQACRRPRDHQPAESRVPETGSPAELPGASAKAWDCLPESREESERDSDSLAASAEAWESGSA